MGSKNSLVIEELQRRIQAIPAMDLAHDGSHIFRVKKMCVQIYVAEVKRLQGRDTDPSEIEACHAVALLHDAVPIAKDSPLRKQSAKLSAEKAKEWLSELGWQNADPSLGTQLKDIIEAIEDHSFSSGRVPRSLLGKCFQDADRLEALGALGLYRTIATGVSMKAALFDITDPWAERRELNDQKFSVDHFYTKLLKLKDTFHTPEAQFEAIQRTEFLKSYLAQLRREIDS
jgi:uncharacterized protein